MLTVVTPVMDEIQFIRAWCENVVRFADQVVVIDTGSTDGTIEILEEYDFELIHRKLIGGRFSGSESAVRNELLDRAKCPWVMRLDVDELVGQDFIDWKNTISEYDGKLFLWFRDYMMWTSMHFIRTRQFDAHFHDMYQFYPRYFPFITANNEHIRYWDTSSEIWLPELQYRHMGHFSPRWRAAYIDIPVFHYHYVMGKKIGYREHQLRNSGIRCTTYFGPHPQEVRYYPWLQQIGEVQR